MAGKNGQQTTSVDQIYATALIEMAEESNVLDEIADEVDQLSNLMVEQPDLVRLISTRALSASQRAVSLEQMFKGRLNDMLYRFLLVVNDKDRLDHLPTICTAFQTLVEERRGVVEIDAYVATHMDDFWIDGLKNRIQAAIGHTVALHQYVDPSIIGGIKFRMGDRLIDGSIATQLKVLERKMLEAGREKMRSGSAITEE